MTELDLAIELGLVKKRSNSFNNTTILNQRLVNHILSLKKGKEEEIEETFEFAEEDRCHPSTTPTQRSDTEKIFELPPLKNFEWERCEVAIDHPAHKPKKILSIHQYHLHRFKEMENELFSEDHFSTLTEEEQQRLIKARDKVNRELAS